MLKDDYLVWKCGKFELSLTRPRIMGILNVTPDSFSDGGENLDPDIAIARGLEMLDQGADIIDVGGESTRPGHTPVSPEEEAKRVVPVIRGLVEEGAIVSIDTRHAELAKMCVRLGASIINDVSGFTDPAMVEVAAAMDCGCVIVHWVDPALSRPRQIVSLMPERAQQARVPLSQRFTLPESDPIMRQVMGFLGDQARTLMRAGVEQGRICVDPGPGFDKTIDQDIIIQRATAKISSMGYPVLCAPSRKRFVGAVCGVEDPAMRDPATLGVILAAVNSGARIVRVHDVAAATQAIDAYWAMTKSDSRRAYISLGSNVGDRVRYLTEATRLINDIPATCVVASSRAYETAPAYGIATPVVNSVVEIRTELSPLVLLDNLLRVEDKLGRVRNPDELGHGPRTIDCDLAWMEGERHSGRKLTLPHPHLGERDYVIVPMEDLMYDPVRFLAHSGVAVLPPEERVGHVRADLGEIRWEQQ